MSAAVLQSAPGDHAALSQRALAAGSVMYDRYTAHRKANPDTERVPLDLGDVPLDVVAHIIEHQADFGWELQAFPDAVIGGTTVLARRLTPDERNQHAARHLAAMLVARFRELQAELPGHRRHYIDVKSRPHNDVLQHLPAALEALRFELVTIFRDDLHAVAGIMIQYRATLTVVK